MVGLGAKISEMEPSGFLKKWSGIHKSYKTYLLIKKNLCYVKNAHFLSLTRVQIRYKVTL